MVWVGMLVLCELSHGTAGWLEGVELSLDFETGWHANEICVGLWQRVKFWVKRRSRGEGVIRKARRAISEAEG